MDKKMIFTGLGGVILGAILMGVFGFLSAPSAMITESNSNFSHDETVEMIIANAEEMGWKIPATHEIHNSVARGGWEVEKVTVIELCNVDRSLL